METKKINKLFYYDDESENLLNEEDAEETTLEEVLDEVFELPDDNISYVGIITDNGEKFRIKSDDYDSYKMYKFDNTRNTYELIDLGDWEKCRQQLQMVF